MSRASVLARGRAAAEAGMTDSCVITRITAATTNPDTGVRAPVIATVYTGRCRVQQRTPGAVRPAGAGEAHQLLLRVEVQLPVTGTSGIAAGDKVTVTAAVNDPDLAGRVFLVRELAHKTEATARRLGVEEATG